MNVNYNDSKEELEYYCHNCHREVYNPHFYKYCPFCGHEYNVDNVNNIRAKIKQLCYEEGVNVSDTNWEDIQQCEKCHRLKRKVLFF